MIGLSVASVVHKLCATHLTTIYVTLCTCHAFLSSADFFQDQFFFKNSFRNTIRVSSSLDPDQA